MHPSIKVIVSLLPLIIFHNRIVQLQETEEIENISLLGIEEYLYSLDIFIHSIQTFAGITKNVIKDLGVMNKMPKDIQNIFDEVRPFIHLINRTENITDGSLTKKCCGKYGCFTTELPFGISSCRPFALLPICQNEMKIKFYLWTRQNPINEDIIDPGNVKSLLNSHFRGDTNVVIYIHGYLGTGNSTISMDLKNAVLNKTDCMFVSVDWTIGARMNYTKSTANSNVVSAVTAYFIQQITKHYKISLENFHIIGVSMGAHIAGGIGKRIPNIGRITGLDPAKPFFEQCDSTVRIAKSDANFVDVIHTDIEMIGAATPLGHLDIYVQGGSLQPACFGFRGCDHPMALIYFIDSIQAKCPYYAYQCDSFDDFMKGKCNVECASDKSLCAPMGYHADQWKHNAKMSPILMFMAMREEKHYCAYHYYVEIKCTDDQIRLWRYGRNSDKLLINIIGEDGETGLQQAHEKVRNSNAFRSFGHIRPWRFIPSSMLWNQVVHHAMATMYFKDSIEAKCPYYAYQCDSFDNFMKGKCSVGCGPDKSSCVPMGFHADQWKRHAKMSPTLMFMATRKSKHYSAKPLMGEMKAWNHCKKYCLMKNSEQKICDRM